VSETTHTSLLSQKQKQSILEKDVSDKNCMILYK